MAKVDYSHIIRSISGKYGDIIFSHTKDGTPYIRRRGEVKQPNTPKQGNTHLGFKYNAQVVRVLGPQLRATLEKLGSKKGIKWPHTDKNGYYTGYTKLKQGHWNTLIAALASRYATALNPKTELTRLQELLQTYTNLPIEGRKTWEKEAIRGANPKQRLLSIHVPYSQYPSLSSGFCAYSIAVILYTLDDSPTPSHFPTRPPQPNANNAPQWLTFIRT